MATGTSGTVRPSTGKKRGKGRLLWTLIVFVGGAYCGLSATKRALIGPTPDWVRHVLGVDTITLPPAKVMPPAPPPPNTGQAVNSNPPNANVAPSTTPPNTANTGGPNTGAPNTGGPNTAGTNGNANSSAPNPSPAPPKQQTGQANPNDSANVPSSASLTGTWEIIDELHPTGSQASKVTSDYVFDSNGTGEFDTNGKKMYDLQWEDAGDYLAITFATDESGGDNWKVKLKYSMNPDKSLLTLSPEGKKDPRGEIYHVGPGVYHRK